ncbi:ABC-2 type transport system ATP-binding protein [Mucilaginibacter pineti]|uniref:ABC-2 type transport system ATP-binding protein n=1 Tax=Mucilaginibacter pineti TaxID=1391627 RepID=A0A1G6UFL7_9SPHI|nr:ABC transporter ATP-binding protein [Mucilaginibacter pineti]SDD40188.1 ABC-2 type transport system ATP-binding protein [Mucilaginibacter pineti]
MIAIEKLNFGYRKKELVLENLSLHLKPGHIYGLLGSNGAGKSSLLHNICGLLFPSSGSCKVAGDNPANRNPQFLQQVYLLPEEIYLPNVSIKSYLDVYAPFYPTFDNELFFRFLGEFDIPKENKLQHMSYGQKKKVMISFALATQAKVLLMDEPTNGLDIPSKKQFRKIIAGVLKEDQLIIISTHQVKDLDSLIDYVLILDDKKIILHEPVENITDKLAFKQVMSLDEVSTTIYSEGALKGYAVITPNIKKEQSRLDMEMFFNAVLSEKQQMLSQFNKQ